MSDEKFSTREALFPVSPSLEIVERVVQEMRDRYQEKLDAVLCKNLRKTENSKDIHLFSLFNYEWMIGEGNEQLWRDLYGEMHALAVKFRKEDFVFVIHPLPTDRYIYHAHESTTWACFPNLVMYASPEFRKRLGLDNQNNLEELSRALPEL